MAEHFLVTGALGCIGAWTVKRLVDEGVRQTIATLRAGIQAGKLDVDRILAT